MQIDVFTLFPEWFEWFAGQRHVANALSRGAELRCASYRDYTPLSGGQSATFRMSSTNSAVLSDSPALRT